MNLYRLSGRHCGIRIVHSQFKRVVQWKGSEREVTLGRQEEIKPIGQPGQYVFFPFTSLLPPFFNDNELSLRLEILSARSGMVPKSMEIY